MKLELYYFPSCPFCIRVLNTIDELNLSIDLKNVHADPLHAQFLNKSTGIDMVPCLFIDGSPMHESRDIIEWLRKNESRLSKV